MYDTVITKNAYRDGRHYSEKKTKLAEGLNESAKAHEEYAFDHFVCHIAKRTDIDYFVQ